MGLLDLVHQAITGGADTDAEAESAAAFPNQAGVGDQRDAMRHMLLAGYLRNRRGGDAYSGAITSAWEALGLASNPSEETARESAMDIANNEIGRRLAEESRRTGVPFRDLVLAYAKSAEVNPEPGLLNEALKTRRLPIRLR